MSLSVPTSFDNKSSSYEPVPPDNHLGVCFGVLDLGTHTESFQGGPEKQVRKVKLLFELPGVSRSDGQTGVISAKYNLSFHEKSTFRKMLDNWLGSGWTEQFKGQRLDFLIGKPCMVNVQSSTDKADPNRKFSWVSAVSKFPKGLPAPEPVRDIVWLDLDEKHLPPTLSAWDADFIRKSHEYLAGGFDDQAPVPNTNNAPAKPAPAAPPGPTAPPRTGIDPEDPNVPF